MKDVAELIRAVGTLLWPIFAIGLFFTYKDEIRTLLRRVKKGKILGQEIELDDSLKQLEQAAKKAETVIPPIDLLQFGQSEKETERTAAELRSQLLIDEELDIGGDEIEKILQEAGRSPKAALLLLASKCEKELRELLLSTGWHGGKRIRSMGQGFDVLRQLEILQPNVVSSARLFGNAQSTNSRLRSYR
jgi:hypothetical protein